MKAALIGALAAILLAGAALAQQPQPVPGQSAIGQTAAAPLTVDSKIEALLGDPRTEAVLRAHIPQAMTSEIFATAGGELSLRQAMGFESSITEAKLQAIAADLARVQAAS